jgi:hypothetical protein
MKTFQIIISEEQLSQLQSALAADIFYTEEGNYLIGMIQDVLDQKEEDIINDFTS